MKKLIVGTTVAVVVVGAGVRAYMKLVAPPAQPVVSTQPVVVADVTQRVQATGTLTPLRSVDVGSQVSGIVQKLFVDFNSIVHKGQLLAELDPAQFQADVDSARAAVESAGIARDQQQRVVDNDHLNLERVEQLLRDDVATQQERDDLHTQTLADEAMLVQDVAAIATAKANLDQANINLSYCRITSPIDGFVIARNADEGQAITARMATPSLYLLGTNLDHLMLVVDVDESDVSSIRPGQTAAFTVDAFPGTTFHGGVLEVRLNATTVSNVVTYQVIVDADNRNLQLKPSMTANVNIEVVRAPQVLAVPNGALRFRPTRQMFAALGQPAPPATPASAPPVLTSAPGAADAAGRNNAIAAARVGSTIDTYFEPLPAVSRAGQVWVMSQQHLKPLAVELGIADSTRTELLSSGLNAGDQVVTGVSLPQAAPSVNAAPAGGVFAPSRGGRGF